MWIGLWGTWRGTFTTLYKLDFITCVCVAEGHKWATVFGVKCYKIHPTVWTWHWVAVWWKYTHGLTYKSCFYLVNNSKTLKFCIYSKRTTRAMAYVTGHILRWPGFNPRPVRVTFSLNKMAMVRIFLRVPRFAPTHYHFSVAPYSFIHIPHTLYNVSLSVLQFSPISIIPQMLHACPFTCLSQTLYCLTNWQHS
jgi:hypothetical protein